MLAYLYCLCSSFCAFDLKTQGVNTMAEADLDHVTPRTRRTRFVCISDTHNASPQNGCFKLPPGDVLIHAGDLTNQGTFGELKKTIDWIAESDYEVKIVVAGTSTATTCMHKCPEADVTGNHDITLDRNFYTEHGHKFHDRYPQDSQACIDYVSNRAGIVYLDHAATAVKLTRPDGPRTAFKVFGSPYSPRSGLWAFGYDPETKSVETTTKTGIWDCIPLDSDIIVTHTPPRHHRDAGEERSCKALRRVLWRVRPTLAVCGHVHAGWGAERVTWDLEEGQVQMVELDRANKKLAKVDLSRKSRRGGPVLDDNGSFRRLPSALHDDSTSGSGTEERKVATHTQPLEVSCT